MIGRVLVVADNVSGLPTLAAIRSALIVMLPFMFLGSLALLLNSFPLAVYREFMARCFGPRWTLFGDTLYNGTFAIMSLSLVFSIGQHLVDQFNTASRIFRANPVIAGLVNLAALFCLLPPETGLENLRWFGVARAVRGLAGRPGVHPPVSAVLFLQTTPSAFARRRA